MNTIKNLFFSVLFSTVLVSSPYLAHAADSQTAVPIATVNIQQARINNQVGNVFDISFALSNDEGVQSDVHYSVRLMAKTAQGYVPVDEKVYDDTLSLGEHALVQRSALYTAPAMLSGSYTLFITSANSQGFPFGSVSLGEVKLTASSAGVELVPGSCSFFSDFSGAFGVKCTATNHVSGTVYATPVVQTHTQSVYGALAERTAAQVSSVALKSGEKKDITIPLTKATTPGAYVVTTALSFNNTTSNTITLAYTVSGDRTVISTISPDADYYAKGSIANIFMLVRGTGNAASDVRITTKNGLLCGKLSGVSVGKPRETFAVPITRDCMNPHISVVITDDKGVMLDQRSMDVQTTSRPQSTSSMGGSTVGLLVGLVLLVLIGLGLLLKKKKTSIPPVILPLLFLGLSFIPFSAAHANTYTAGPIDEITVTINISGGSTTTPPVYPDASGTTIRVDGDVHLTTGTGPYTVTLSAITVGTSRVDLFTDPVILTSTNPQFYGTTQYLTAPRCDVANPCPRSELVTFTTSVIAPPPGGGGPGGSCSAYVRFVGSFRYGGVLWLGPSNHPAVNVTVALEGTYSGTVNPGGPDYVNFVIPANATQSTMGEFYGVGGFDHAWVDHTDLAWACGDSTQNYMTCFVADTQVDMADGTKKNIQDVKIGDVLKGETSNNTVLGFHRPNLDGKVYSFNGGRYFVTEEHPFKTTDGWKSINPNKTRTENIGITVTELKVGDTLVTDHGLVKLTSIDGKVESPDTQLYNFKLTGDRTYYADGYLVHNKNVCDEVQSCGNNRSCIESGTGYRITPPPGGSCPVGCRFPDGTTKPFCTNSQYNAFYCPNPVTGACN